jgi:hypothetical protein
MRRGLCAVLATVVLIGCGSGTDKYKAQRPKTVTAQGVLTRKGKPLSRVVVMCRPVEGKYACAAMTDESGRFSLTTFNPDPGAVPGSYQVSLQTSVQQDEVAVAEPPEDVVLPARPKPPKPTPSLPTKYAAYETSQLTLVIPPEGSRELKIDLPD